MKHADDDLAPDDGEPGARQADLYGTVHADPDLSLPPHREPAGAVHWLLRAVGAGR